jgi:DNA invertase Pin-like site-specific DNA recombinase
MTRRSFSKCSPPSRPATVTPIDGLARSFDLFAIVKQIVDAKAQFRSLAEPWADIGTSTGRLMIAALGGPRRHGARLIRTRSAEGPNRAQKRGKHMGRSSKLDRRAEGRASPATSGRGATLTRTRPDVSKITISWLTAKFGRTPGFSKFGSTFAYLSLASYSSP